MAVCCDKEYLGPLLNDLLTAVESTLFECGRPVCRAFIDTSGAPPWDFCCDCGDGVGQLWVSVYEINHLNTTNAGTMRCISQFEAQVTIGLLRCAWTQDDQGNAPAADDISLQSLDLLKDRVAINQAIICAWGQDVDPDIWELGSWASLGPEGGCVGGQVNLKIRFSDPRCA